MLQVYIKPFWVYIKPFWEKVHVSDGVCMLACTAARRAGYSTPSSRDSSEIVCMLLMYSESRDSESPPRKYASPASKKRLKGKLEADTDALSDHSSDPEAWDPISKTPEEFAAWCAEYEHGNRQQMAQSRPMGIAGILRVS
jgi:hypothetical protein